MLGVCGFSGPSNGSGLSDDVKMAREAGSLLSGVGEASSMTGAGGSARRGERQIQRVSRNEVSADETERARTAGCSAGAGDGRVAPEDNRTFDSRVFPRRADRGPSSSRTVNQLLVQVRNSRFIIRDGEWPGTARPARRVYCSSRSALCGMALACASIAVPDCTRML